MTEDKVCALFRLINFVLFRSVWFGTGVCLCVYLVNVEKANLYLYLRRFIIRCCFLRLFTYLIMLKWVLKNSRYNFGSIWPILYEFWRWQRYCSCANYICFWRNQPKNRSSKLVIVTPSFEFFGLHILDFDLCERVSVWLLGFFGVVAATAAVAKKSDDKILVFENDKRMHSPFVTVNAQ